MPAVLITLQRVLNVLCDCTVDVFVNAFLACKRGLFVIMNAAETHRSAVANILVDPLYAENLFIFSVRNKRGMKENATVI